MIRVPKHVLMPSMDVACNISLSLSNRITGPNTLKGLDSIPTPFKDRKIESQITQEVSDWRICTA